MVYRARGRALFNILWIFFANNSGGWRDVFVRSKNLSTEFIKV
jgi:hypothetical protein